MVNRKIAPKIKDAIDYTLELKPCQKFLLDNNVPVYTIDAGAEDVLQLELVFHAGNWYESANLLAATTNHLLKNGTASRTAFAINEHFEYYGSYLNRNCYSETATINLHSLTRHLNELLPMIREVITTSVFPQEELDIYRQNMKQKLAVNLSKCDFIANRLIDEYLYGFEHPYGRYSSEAAYNALHREQLESYFRDYYVNGHCVIFVGGKLPTDIIAQLNKNFGDLPLNRNAIPVAEHKIIPAADHKYRISNDSKGVQGAIRIASDFPNRHHPDFTKAQVLNTVFGGYFGSRLSGNIREDKGYTYGIYSYLQNHVQRSAWMISTEAGTEVCEATISEVYKEMERLRNEPVGDEELLLVKNYLIGTLLGDLDGPFHIIGRWKSILLNGLSDDYFNESVATIKGITSEEIQTLANKYLQPEKFYELVVV